MKILIVDDNEMVRRGVKRILSERPEWKACGEASDGDEALAKAKELRPDLILLDISMPGANGLEVARRLRRDASEAKIVIMSQHDPVYLLPRARESGADACLDKDCLSTDLLPILAEFTHTSNASEPQAQTKD